MSFEIFLIVQECFETFGKFLFLIKNIVVTLKKDLKWLKSIDSEWHVDINLKYNLRIQNFILKLAINHN